MINSSTIIIYLKKYIPSRLKNSGIFISSLTTELKWQALTLSEIRVMLQFWF